MTIETEVDGDTGLYRVNPEDRMEVSLWCEGARVVVGPPHQFGEPTWFVTFSLAELLASTSSWEDECPLESAKALREIQRLAGELAAQYEAKQK
jgi:hypothetical protein